jgi:hypothetical protein
LSKYLRFTAASFAAALLLLGTIGTASASQYTYTCQSPDWDMLAMMFMQKSYLAQNYYVSGTHTPGNGVVLHNDVPQVATQHSGIWDTGKINSVKDYRAQPGHSAPPYWGFPWDINLFDDSYVYLWITEYAGTSQWWTDPYAYKAFNNGSTKQHDAPHAALC